jgi:multiple sugar transport system substrate-binding protein
VSGSRAGRAVIGVLSVCALLVGCSSHDRPSRPPSTPASSATSPSGPSTLALHVYGDPATIATYREIADAFHTAHPEVTMKVTASADAESSTAAVDAEIEAGSAPDVFLVDRADLAGFVDTGEVQPVDELLEARNVPFGDGFQRVGLAAFSANDALSCMPNDVSPYVVFYNRRLLKPRFVQDANGNRVLEPSNGWTWDSFLGAAQRIARGGVKGAYVAPDLIDVTPLVLSNGATIVDDDRRPTTLTLSSDATRIVLEMVAELDRDQTVSLAKAQLRQQGALAWFEQGKLGMMIGTRALVPKLRDVKGLAFDVYPMPGLQPVRTLAAMNGYCIAKDSTNVNVAADFIAFAVGADGGARIAAASGSMVPSSVDVLHADAFVQPGQFPRHADVFSKSVLRADPVPYSTAWRAVVDATSPTLARVLTDQGINIASEVTPQFDAALRRLDDRSVPLFTPPIPTPTTSGTPSPTS